MDLKALFSTLDLKLFLSTFSLVFRCVSNLSVPWTSTHGTVAALAAS